MRNKASCARLVDQLARVQDAMIQPGQHAVVFGERGVGKTSLASVSAAIAPPGVVAVRVNCDPTDTYSAIRHKALDEVKFRTAVPNVGFTPEIQSQVTSAAEMMPSEDITPHDVRVVLARLASAGIGTAMMFDEFDAIRDTDTRSLMASTIKTLSDQSESATIVLVGVADTVDELIAEHASVERALQQVYMPRMTTAELAEIVTRGLATVDMTITDAALNRITRLSQGLPHYTHLLALSAGRTAILAGSDEVTVTEVKDAISNALDSAQESLVRLYHDSVTSNRDTLYPQVVLAAASLDGDERGYFSTADLKEPLEKVLGRRVQYGSFSNHLHKLAGSRGPLLELIGTSRRFRIRFKNPLLRPYVLMRGLDDGLVDAGTLDSLTS